MDDCGDVAGIGRPDSVGRCGSRSSNAAPKKAGTPPASDGREGFSVSRSLLGLGLRRPCLVRRSAVCGVGCSNEGDSPPARTSSGACEPRGTSFDPCADRTPGRRAHERAHRVAAISGRGRASVRRLRRGPSRVYRLPRLKSKPNRTPAEKSSPARRQGRPASGSTGISVIAIAPLIHTSTSCSGRRGRAW